MSFDVSKSCNFNSDCNRECNKHTCLPIKKDQYTILKNKVNISYNNFKKTSTKEIYTIAYNPLLLIKGCYCVKCCNVVDSCCYHYNKYYYNEFNLYNNNEFALYDLGITIQTLGIDYVNNTLMLNGMHIDDTSMIKFKVLEPHKYIKISFMSNAYVALNDKKSFADKIKVYCSFLDFNNKIRYFHQEKYMMLK